MIILSIETSCDETALALVEADLSHESEQKFKIIGHELYSQTELHAKYGGVFPVMAKREHEKNLIPLLNKLLEEPNFSESGILNQESETKEKITKILERESELQKQFLEYLPNLGKPPIDAIAVTVGPGLEPCLWTGINFARALAYIWDLPIVPTNHMEGHIFSVLATEHGEQKTITYPALSLLVSGGHTELVYCKSQGSYEIIGRTKDDAVGEAFDKVARILGLPYPGGPQISALADEARRSANHESRIMNHEWKLPRPMLHSKDLNFSFSGLKTAVLYTVKKIPDLTLEIKKMLALEFEEAVVEVLTTKTKSALTQYETKSLIVGGGVIANKSIRTSLSKLAKEFGIEFCVPTKSLSTDNAIMIGIAGLINFKAGKSQRADAELRANGNLNLGA
ncbi:MAG: tRNA (adenosine(37)-N6)-threonylcarbamoyltransferase complex transferase subunit TsaD [Patescibacteria group bacterium]